MSKLLRALALLVVSAPAFAANEVNTVFFRDPTGASITVRETVLPAVGQNTYADGIASSNHAGSAFAPTQTLRSFVDLDSQQPGSTSQSSWLTNTAKSTSSFSKEVLVDGGTSNLPAGTVVPLDLMISFHGVVEVGATSTSNLQRALTSLDSSLRYEVVDLDDVVCGEGCRPRELATFSYGGRGVFDYNFGGDGLVDLNVRHSWSARGSTSGFVDFVGPTISTVDQTYVPSTGYTVFTGTLLVTFESAVGHTLRHTASLDAFAQALGVGAVGWSLGDFSATFDADLSSPVAGLVLVGETLGVLTAVPEPGAWALMLAGLAAVGGLARRRAAAAARR